MHTFTLDTSGTVSAHMWRPMQGRRQWVRWSDLSPFTQGYIEAMAAGNFARVAALPSNNDDTGHCKHCGRDNVGEEVGPCSDDCPRQSIAFSDLAPETLARIIADCEAYERTHADLIGSSVHPEGLPRLGRLFWINRHNGAISSFPPLTVQLGDDGKVRFA